MPRKTNGMPFEIHPSPKKAANGKNILYVRPRSRHKITMEQLDDYCANHYALRPGELTRAFQAFIEATSYYLSEGYRVETLIGSFAPKIGLRRELTDPDEVKTTEPPLLIFFFLANKCVSKSGANVFTSKIPCISSSLIKGTSCMTL